MRIDINESPSEEDINEISCRLQQFNDTHRETDGIIKYTIKAVDNDNLLGAVYIILHGNWLEVDLLWVDEKHRGNGIGSKLIIKAEEIARANGCTMSCLSTYSFQARPFYERYGYKVVYTRENYPVTNKKYYMEKIL